MGPRLDSDHSIEVVWRRGLSAARRLPSSGGSMTGLPGTG